jgi:signal transduction histidine kinase
VQHLLDLARDRPPDREPVDLGALIRRDAARWDALAAGLGRRVVGAGDGHTWAQASRSAVTHVVDALVDNALRYGTGQVTVRASHEQGAATVSVADEGTFDAGGPDVEPLFRRRESERGSTGIGLHLARRLTEAEGGRLRLTSRSPTTFTLMLRSSAGPDGPPAALPAVDEGKRTSPPR